MITDVAHVENADIANTFGAASGGGEIVFLMGVPRRLSPERALVLAAWLVAMADMSDNHAAFKAVLAKVEST